MVESSPFSYKHDKIHYNPLHEGETISIIITIYGVRALTRREKIDPRAAIILRGKAEGKTQDEIADELGVTERTVYNIMRRPTYLGLLAENREKYDAILNEMSEDKATTIRLEAMKERGRRDRAGSKLMVQAAESLGPLKCEESCPHWAKMHKQRTEDFNTTFDYFIAIGALEPWQLQKFRLFMLKRPWRHINKDNWDK